MATMLSMAESAEEIGDFGIGPLAYSAPSISFMFLLCEEGALRAPHSMCDEDEKNECYADA